MPSQSPMLVQLRGSDAYREALDALASLCPGVRSRHDLARLALRELAERRGVALPDPQGKPGRPRKPPVDPPPPAG